GVLRGDRRDGAHRPGPGHGSEEQCSQAHGGRVAGSGADDHRGGPRHPRRLHHERGAAAPGLRGGVPTHAGQRWRGKRRRRRPRAAVDGDRLRPRAQDARLHQRPRSAGGALRLRPGRPPRWGRDRLPRPGHAHLRARAAGCHDRQRARLPDRDRPPPDRHVDLAGLPLRGRHGEPGDGRCAGPRHDRDRQRRPRAGDQRPVLDARGHGRPHRRRRHLDHHGGGRRGAEAGHLHDRRRPHRRRYLGHRRRHDAGRHGHRARRPRAHDGRPGQADRRRRDGGGRAGRDPGGHGGPAALRGRRDAALPGIPDRPAADGGGPGRDLHRYCADHRERVRGPVHVRQRTGPPRRRRAHRRPPRRDPWAGAVLQRAGRGHRHPGGSGARAGGPGLRRCHRGAGRPPRRPGLPGLRRAAARARRPDRADPAAGL
ncbi:MAG: UDP-N-acetylglucosamine 1-carboxyvinyltransferase, partial [uncultured Blastococcus sp.]